MWVRVDGPALAALLRSERGPVAQDLLRRGLRVQNRARQLCPVNTGRLRNSITVELVIVGGIPVVRIGTNVEYARWVHDGTGVYGPLRRPIRPRRAKVLAFTPRGSSQTVFATQVRGTPGRPFLRDALEAAA